MKKSFMCSLICHSGIIGGVVEINGTSITYKTNKLTVDRQYRNLTLPLHKISSLTWKWVVFPIATVQMTDGKAYRLIIFNKKGFQKYYTAGKRS